MIPPQLRTEVESLFSRIGNANYYEFLGVPTNATDADIRRVFREKARRMHIDAYPGVELGDLRPKMERVFGELSRIQSILTNREKREEYDARMSLNGQEAPTSVAQIFMADEHFRAAKRLIDRGDFANARGRLDEACRLNPNEPEFNAYANWVRFCLLPRGAEGKPVSVGEVERIRKELSACADQQERADYAWVFLGNIARAMGDANQAVRHYSRALLINPQNTEAASNIRVIKMRADQEKKKGLFGGLFGRKS